MASYRIGHSAIKIEDWPERDRAAWYLDCSPSDPFDDDGPHLGATLSSASLKKASDGYGRWLLFLTSRGWLDPVLSPLERVTRARLADYFGELRKCGNADWTVIGRFAELRTSLRMLSPGQNVSWIVRPYGLSVYAALPKTKRHVLVPDSKVLFDWGIEMMDGADLTFVTGRTRYRDGLLIAMLAARARRRRSMHAIRADKELFREGPCYRVKLERMHVKTRVPDSFKLPDVLTPYIKRYLDLVRPGLLGAADWEQLWITRYGAPMTENGITMRIVRLTKRQFGVSFGPHRFRHAVGTTITLCMPENPGLPAAVLGISANVTSAHYIQAGQIEASRDYAKLVDGRRAAARMASQTAYRRHK